MTYLPCLYCGDDTTFAARASGVRPCRACGWRQAVVVKGGRVRLVDTYRAGRRRLGPRDKWRFKE